MFCHFSRTKKFRNDMGEPMFASGKPRNHQKLSTFSGGETSFQSIGHRLPRYLQLWCMTREVHQFQANYAAMNTPTGKRWCHSSFGSDQLITFLTCETFVSWVYCGCPIHNATLRSVSFMLPTPSGIEEDASSCCRGPELSKEEGLQVMIYVPTG